MPNTFSCPESALLCTLLDRPGSHALLGSVSCENCLITHGAEDISSSTLSVFAPLGFVSQELHRVQWQLLLSSRLLVGIRGAFGCRHRGQWLRGQRRATTASCLSSLAPAQESQEG